MGFFSNFTANHKAKQARLKVDKDTARALNMLEELRVELNNRVIDQKRLDLEKAQYEAVAGDDENEIDDSAAEDLSDLFDDSYGDEPVQEKSANASNDDDDMDFEDEEEVDVDGQEDPGITAQKTSEYLLVVTALEQHMKDHGIVRIDIREIDEKIQNIADYMLKAVHQDDGLTADQSIEALKWGIILGRADMENADKGNQSELITQRLKTLNQFITAIIAAQNVGITVKAIEKLNVQKNEIDQSLARANKRLEKFDKKVLIAFKKHVAAGKDLNPDDQKIQNILTEKDALKTQGRGLVQSISHLEKEENVYREAIANVRVAMLLNSVHLNQNVPQMMKEIAEDTLRNLAEQDKALEALIAANDQVLQVMLEWETPPAMKLKEERAYQNWIQEEQEEIMQKEEADAIKREISEKIHKQMKKTLITTM